MADRSLRGMRLGTQSLQSEEGVDFSPRVVHRYRTASGQIEEVVFAAEAEPPATWECRSGEGVLIDGVAGATDAALTEEKVQRTHWDMLMERRSIPELEEILQEQLDNLRARRSAAREQLGA